MSRQLLKFNDGVAYVLDKPIEYKYYQQGDLIIGIDDSCTFIKSYYYDRPSPGFYAFGGHKFDIPLENGEVVHCYGQWWDGGYEKVESLLGEELVSVTYRDIQSLENCFVFTGSCAIKDSIEKLRQTYTGEVYEYRAYEAMLKGRDYPVGKG
ncbi:hypothetical protein SAMN05661091_4084 [Paenibacillus uliginis N3/975]|uniref:Uncharacterized protein n=1 Tax=Paenibacillus uliginis N3/975 TaxID=1313296 RepID=A0A1X7HLK4_9BACL|nr:hypothetical protein [Paenibacillus uliginis]SMF88051.1 hypothetical protein SAMN05661091_4084 [Paenibacillus uliginis N3/975]